MLSFQEKIDVCSTFPELQRKDISLGRVNYHYEESAYDKKTVIYHLHPNGNGFVYAGLIKGVPTDDKGFVNIRDYTADELRSIIGQSIRSLTVTGKSDVADAAPARSEDGVSRTEKQSWFGPDNQSLLVHYEDELWYIYAGANLEAAFETWEEAEEYLIGEGFSPPVKH